VYLLHDFLINGNSLVIILPEQTPEEFIRRASHIPRGTDAAGFAAKQAVLNAVLALSGLQQLPLLIPTTSSKEANREQCAKIASVGNAKQLAHKAAHPYFERAKDAMKECFALPNLNTTSALLALSQCCQIMDDTTSAYVYANMAFSMCDLAGDAVPLQFNSRTTHSLHLVPVQAQTRRAMPRHGRATSFFLFSNSWTRPSCCARLRPCHHLLYCGCYACGVGSG